MSLTLLAPLGLAALAALSLPVLIHLIRRPEQRITDFAALRWLSEKQRPRQRLRLHEWLLLALRLLLLALLALLLARPVLTGAGPVGPAWVVVAPGVDLAALPEKQPDWHWLAPGFPALAAPRPTGEPPVASLLRELDAELPAGTEIHVIVPEHLAGLDAERLRLSRAVDWRAVPGAMNTPRATETETPIRLAVRHDGRQDQALAYLRAAVAAWAVDEPGRYSLDVQGLDVPLPADARWLIWLGGEAPQAKNELPPEIDTWIARGGVALLADRPQGPGRALWRNAQGEVLARGGPAELGRRVYLMGPLTATALPEVLAPDFPARLRGLMRGEAEAPTSAPAEAVSPRVEARRAAGHGEPLDPGLALAIALVFLLERLWASRGRAEARP